MVDEVVSSESNTLTWSDVEDAAELAFRGFEPPGLEFGALEWANQAWEILIQAGLATYSINDELERSQVVIRFLALADFYLEFCSVAWEESHEPNYRLWADTLEIIHYNAKELISSNYDSTFYDDDEYELDDDDLKKLADNVRLEVLSALIESFGNISVLFVSLWRSNLREADEDGCVPYETDNEILHCNITPQKHSAYEWLTQQCFGQVAEEVELQQKLTLTQGIQATKSDDIKDDTTQPHTRLFSTENYDLLKQLNEKPTGDVYLAHEEHFKKYVEKPFQELLHQVATQLPDVIINRLELEKARFTSWGKYKASFYSKGLHPSAGASFYIFISHYSLSFGLFIPSISVDRARLVANFRNYPKATKMAIQNFPNNCTPVGTNKVSYTSSDLEDWLKHIARKNSSIKDIEAYSRLLQYKLFDYSNEQIVEHIIQTFKGLFPLFLLATCSDPISAIKEYLESPYKKPDANELYNQGVEEYQQGNYQKSINKFNEVLQIEPDLAAAYYYRGRAKAQIGDLHGARKNYSKSLRLQPNQIEVSNELGNIDYLLGNYGSAIENYNWTLDINPNYATAYYKRGLAYLQLEDKLKAIEDFRQSAKLFDQQDNIDNYEEVQRILKTIQLDYSEPSFTEICKNVRSKGLRISESTLRRYHLALKSRKFVILSGISGTGKTWLTKAYAQAVEAEYLLAPVAPNWTTNEDLLGYLSPIDNKYHDTDFSTFLEKAEEEYKQAQAEKRTPRPYHLVLDEMNLARVEYYFAKFLSAMEVRMREGVAQIQLASEKQVLLPPNLYFIGTVNVDETTHSFADKVYDRAQLIELEAPRQDLDEYLGEVPYREMLMQIWDEVHTVAPFAFRVLDEIKTYVKEAEALDVPWQDALDEQLLQKILPKLKGADDRVGVALQAFVDIVKENEFPLSHKKATKMLETFNQHGFTSYF
jgi:tetratricopeptide (TPR) repeat protein